MKKEPPDVTLTKSNNEIRQLGFRFHWHIVPWVEKNEIDNFMKEEKLSLPTFCYKYGVESGLRQGVSPEVNT